LDYYLVIVYIKDGILQAFLVAVPAIIIASGGDLQIKGNDVSILLHLLPEGEFRKGLRFNKAAFHINFSLCVIRNA